MRRLGSNSAGNFSVSSLRRVTAVLLAAVLAAGCHDQAAPPAAPKESKNTATDTAPPATKSAETETATEPARKPDSPADVAALKADGASFQKGHRWLDHRRQSGGRQRQRCDAHSSEGTSRPSGIGFNQPLVFTRGSVAVGRAHGPVAALVAIDEHQQCRAGFAGQAAQPDRARFVQDRRPRRRPQAARGPQKLRISTCGGRSPAMPASPT